MPARPFTPAEVSALEFHFLAQHRHRDRMMVIVGTNVGYRITELLTWTVGQILTREGDIAHEITVTRALLKGGNGLRKRSVRSRRVVLNERARQAIRDYLASLGRVPLPDEYLFRSRQGGNQPLHRAQAHDILKAACRACGIDATRISTHSLRKTFARAVYDASGHDIILAQRLLGHSSPIVTGHYLESTQDELDNLVLGLSAGPRHPAAALAS
jgi:integrase